MQKQQTFHIQVETDMPFDTAIERVTIILKQYGFGIITEVDVTRTMQEKLGAEFAPYRILGACNPPFAHKILSADPRVGLFLPCNVVVWDRGDKRIVMAIEPEVMVMMIDNPDITQLAHEVSCLLHRAMDAFARTSL